MNIIQRFKQGLQKSSNYLKTNIIDSLKSNEINDEVINEIESILISADIGLEVTNQLIEKIKQTKNSQDVDSNLILKLIASEINSILIKCESSFFSQNKSKPNVLMFVGINGSGKTTTIGKLIYKLNDKNKILVAACDTFRAAAVDQLNKWSNKYNVDFFGGLLNQDPASVAFKACEKAINEKHDYVMIDTAGRLSNNINLINQLKKIKSVIQKSIGDRQLNNILILDGTNGSAANAGDNIVFDATDADGTDENDKLMAEIRAQVILDTSSGGQMLLETGSYIDFEHGTYGSLLGVSPAFLPIGFDAESFDNNTRTSFDNTSQTFDVLEGV